MNPIVTQGRRSILEGTIDALRKAPEDHEGKVVVSKEGMITILEHGLGAVSDVEELEERAVQESRESQ